MPSKNSILTGILIGLPFPALGWLAAYLLKNNLYFINKPAVPYLVAIGFNLILMRVISKKEMVEAVRGIMITTFAFMMLVLLFVIHPIV